MNATGTDRADGAEGPVPLVRLERVSKRFGDLAANSDVSFDIAAGSVVALVGENGAGKTTAMNILAGLYLADAGHIMVGGEPLEPGSPRAAIAAGIGMVHQQFRLVEALTGFENVSLALHRGAIRQPRRAGDDIARLVAELGFEIDLGRRVWQMPLAARQQLEILRVLAVGAKVLILDEPTSVLSRPEGARLFELIGRISASGRAVVLISHKLDEVMGIADDIVVMRSGRVVHCGRADALDMSTLARLIVGEREIAEPRRPQSQPGRPLLEVRDLHVDDDLGVAVVRGVSFDVHSGELVALVGVTGNGQSELLDAIGGLRPTKRGRIAAPRTGGRRAFGFIPAQHLGTAIAPGLTVAENAMIGHQRRPLFGGLMRRSVRTEWARQVVSRFAVAGDRNGPAGRLSGGNLQRLVLGREFAHETRLIVASYPTRGLDVASAAAIRSALAEAAAGGAAILLASEELDETLAIATRILVMHRGLIVAERSPGGIGSQELGRLMTVGAA